MLRVLLLLLSRLCSHAHPPKLRQPVRDLSQDLVLISLSLSLAAHVLEERPSAPKSQRQSECGTPQSNRAREKSDEWFMAINW